MNKKNESKGLMVVGSLRSTGITTYMKQGQLITRVATSAQKRSNTLGQFKQRQKMRHTTALWQMLKYCDPLFTKRPTAYLNFAMLANKLPVVYVDKEQMSHASFLMNDIPVSDGTLPTVNQQLGMVNGTPALITDLKAQVKIEVNEHVSKVVVRPGRLWLFTAEQVEEKGAPYVRFSKRNVEWGELVEVDGHLALLGEEFADDMKGWALVREQDHACSPQGIITRCTRYEEYTTDEALKTAAKSYGGITDTPF